MDNILLHIKYDFYASIPMEVIGSYHKLPFEAVEKIFGNKLLIIKKNQAKWNIVESISGEILAECEMRQVITTLINLIPWLFLKEKNQYFALHGTAFTLNDHLFILTGKTHSGKTFLSYQECIKHEAELVADDLVIYCSFNHCIYKDGEKIILLRENGNKQDVNYVTLKNLNKKEQLEKVSKITVIDIQRKNSTENNMLYPLSKQEGLRLLLDNVWNDGKVSIQALSGLWKECDFYSYNNIEDAYDNFHIFLIHICKNRGKFTQYINGGIRISKPNMSYDRKR